MPTSVPSAPTPVHAASTQALRLQTLYLQEHTFRAGLKSRPQSMADVSWRRHTQLVSSSEGMILKAVSWHSPGTEQPVQTHPFTGSLLSISQSLFPQCLPGLLPNNYLCLDPYHRICFGGNPVEEKYQQ